MKSRTSILFCFFMLFIITTSAQQNANKTVELAGTKVLNLHSDINGKDYELRISLPSDYDDPSKTFPTLYVLDGQWDFPFVYSLYGQLYFDGMVPSMVVVGITWGGENANYDSLRAQDFTPTNYTSYPQSGGAPEFLQVIKKEIIPFVESNLKVKKDDRALMGSSFGGLFTLYTMFNETELFDKYVLTSPAIGWDNGVIYKMENEFSKNNSSIPARLYMAVGGYEDYKSFEKFAKQIKDHNYEGLEIETSVLAKTGHSGGKAEGYSKGMRFVYQYPDLTLDNKLLEQYAGMYESEDGMKVQLVNKDQSLIAILPTLQQAKLFAKSKTEFYEPGVFNFVDMETDKSGNVTGFLLRRFGFNIHFNKIKE